MSKYMKVAMEDGSELYIETVETGERSQCGSWENPESDNVPAMSTESVKKMAVEVGELFGKALPAATGFAKGVVEQIRKDIPSDEMEMEFSFALSSEAKVAICSGGAETCFKVKLKWKKEEPKPEN